MSKKSSFNAPVFKFKELVVALTEKNCRLQVDGSELCYVVHGEATPSSEAEVSGYTKWKTVEKLLERMQPDYLIEENKVHGLREAFIQFPGEGPCNYIINNDDAYALKYEVELRYKNRPNDPIEE